MLLNGVTRKASPQGRCQGWRHSGREAREHLSAGLRSERSAQGSRCLQRPAFRGNGFGHFCRNKSAPPAGAGTRSKNVCRRRLPHSRSGFRLPAFAGTSFAKMTDPLTPTSPPSRGRGDKVAAASPPHQLTRDTPDSIRAPPQPWRHILRLHVRLDAEAEIERVMGLS
jgi:hypothetical protein